MNNKCRAPKKSSLALNSLLKHINKWQIDFGCFYSYTINEKNKARKTFHEERQSEPEKLWVSIKAVTDVPSVKDKLEQNQDEGTKKYKVPFWMSHSILRMSTDVFTIDILQALS